MDHANEAEHDDIAEEPRRRLRGMPRRRAIAAGAGGLLAAGLIGGGVASATSNAGSTAASTSAHSARPEHGGPIGGRGGGGGITGVVTAVASGSITLDVTRAGLDSTVTPGSSVTVATDSSTNYESQGPNSSATPSASSVVVGITVLIRPTDPSASSLTAADVDIIGPSLSGVVVSTSGTTVVIRDDQGFERTIHTSESTTYTEAGQSASSSDLATGAEIVATGTIDTDQTDLDATNIMIVLPEVEGRVTAVSGTTITIDEFGPLAASSANTPTTLAVDTTGSTTFTRGPGHDSSSSVTITDVTVGKRILAFGTPGSTGTFNAVEVVIGGGRFGATPFGFGGGHGPGRGGSGHGGPGGGFGGGPGGGTGGGAPGGGTGSSDGGTTSGQSTPT